ncbi:response regulator [uncultured Halopseudomonas sp.]|jgi:CheY-like chemotaxis protein|uniref:response regulator n=1 Tax=uncultured Halopseudomonas sp. TaxID=2901193 RepID=UPI0030ECFA9D|tara:strand:+ start:4021 stop:4419 length:399 start_codon:yes stop_codon:yes gene_type:complete
MAELERVMYVEDEPDIRAVAQLALEVVGGLTVSLCERGDLAVAQAERFDPQMILLDVMMPGMDGPSTLKALRDQPQLSHVPIAFMTAKVQAHEVEHFKSLGAVGVIAKPFDPMTLAQQVRTLWRSAVERGSS